MELPKGVKPNLIGHRRSAYIRFEKTKRRSTQNLRACALTAIMFIGTHASSKLNFLSLTVVCLEAIGRMQRSALQESVQTNTFPFFALHAACRGAQGRLVVQILVRLDSDLVVRYAGA